jgi:2-keto-4-pentenoate hydratase/2-oxohepta-3-ene-1,7-dioic acid hydratase in catechol pathway
MSRVEHVARYRIGSTITYGRREAGAFVRLDAAPWLGGRETGVIDTLGDVEFLPPVVPSKIVCVGLNYRAHIAESMSVGVNTAARDEPLLFLKPPSALIGTGAAIRYPRGVTRLDPEAELAVVIGRRAWRVAESEAYDAVAGLTCFNDVSARNYQATDGQWTRAKGFDTFAPLGPWMSVGLPPDGLEVECRVNGRSRQRGNTSDLLFSVPYLIRHVSHVMTLEPGDVIATGTPAGVAPVAVGDRIEIEVEGIGVLENRVSAEEGE